MSQRVKSPIRWLGGKGILCKHLFPLISDHDCYVELFGGACSVLLGKPSSVVEIYNDVDPGLCDFFDLLSDVDLFPLFYRRALLGLHSRALYGENRLGWCDVLDRVERVYRWYMIARQSFGGRFGKGWAFSTLQNHAFSCMNGLLLLPSVSVRLRDVSVRCGDWELALDCYDSVDTFFYCDPPYVHGTRGGVRYTNEMSDDDHERLIDRLGSVRGRVLLSGYRNPIYDKLGWRSLDFDTVCFVVGRTRISGLQGSGKVKATQSRVETVWFNYDLDTSLFGKGVLDVS